MNQRLVQRDRHRVVLVFPPIWPVTGPNLRALHSPHLEWILCQETPGPDTTHVAYLNASGDQNWDSSQNHAASSDSHPPSAVLVLLNLLSILNDVGRKTSYLYSGLLEICFLKSPICFGSGHLLILQVSSRTFPHKFCLHPTTSPVSSPHWIILSINKKDKKPGFPWWSGG